MSAFNTMRMKLGQTSSDTEESLILELRLNQAHQRIAEVIATADRKFRTSLSYLVAMRRRPLSEQNAQ